MRSSERAVPAKSTRRGRKSSQPHTELGLYIQKCIDCLGITRIELAQRLQVSPSTISRLLNGDTRVVQRVSAESICDALELDAMDRREFMKLAGVAGASTFAFATGTHIPKLTRSKIDLELAEDHAEALERLLDKGESHYVLQSAKQWYDKLLGEEVSRDKRLATTQLRYGLLLGRSQELVLPWHQRQFAIRTYNALEQRIILRFELNTFQQEYASLISRRGPLYREIGYYEQSEFQYEYGLEIVRGVTDPLIRAMAFRNRAHNSATRGNEYEWKWRLDEALKDALHMNFVHREAALAMIKYIEAEGYKRLAFDARRELPRHVRINYAKKSLESFQQSLSDIEHNPEALYLLSQKPTENPSVKAHCLLSQVSISQCLVLLDAEEAISFIGRIRDDVTKFYPGLLSKMERTLRFARGQLLPDRTNPLLLFGRDARPMARGEKYM